MSRAVVVVPCYNEAKRLDVAQFHAFARGAGCAELLFVNDGSRDATPELIERLHHSHPRRFGFLHLAKNSGKAEAVRQGILMALGSKPDYVGFWDADLATPLSHIEPFCRVLDARAGVEAVIGTRLRLLGHDIQRRPLRYWLGRLFANTASVALGARIFDTQCGAKLFRVTPHLEQAFTERFLARSIFDVELFARLQRLARAGLRPAVAETIYEYPLERWHEVAGGTIRSGDFLKAALELAHIYWTYLRPGAPPAPPRTFPLGELPSKPDHPPLAEKQHAA